MSLVSINSALRAAYIAAVGTQLPTAYEGRDFTRPQTGIWATVQNFPAASDVASLGRGGHDLITGFFQISFFVPEGDGVTELLTKSGTVLGHFKNGARFTHSGHEVKVRRTTLSQIRRDAASAFLTTTLSVYWDAEVIR